MIRTHYTIQLESYLSHCSGEGDLFVDMDIRTDAVGLPIISGRAIKGLLRESMEETLERQRKPSEEIDRYFGTGGFDGSTQALKFVSNAVIDSYSETFEELSTNGVASYEMKELYTKVISQTRIGEKGTAADGSLRFTRVIDHLKLSALHFYIDSEEDLEKSELFRSTLLNLRAMGLNRNRGLGAIRVSFVTSEPLSPIISDELTITEKMNVTVRLEAPLLLPKKSGDQNTTYVDDSIGGNVLLGALAYRYLSKGGSAKDADFLNAFVYGGLSFSALTKNGAHCIPMIVASDKYAAIREYRNAYAYQSSVSVSETKWKTKQGYISTSGNLVETDKVVSFHMSRKNGRLAGSSTSGDGAIFYYESIAPFQKFYGSIEEKSCSKGLLQRIMQKTGNEISLNLGASKSTQYGAVFMQLSKVPEAANNTAVTQGKGMYLVLETPCLVYNKEGYPSLNVKDFEAYLSGCTVTVAAAEAQFLQQFNGQWKCKTPREMVWEPGTTFYLRDAENIPSTGIGERTHTGLGKFSLYSEEEMQGLIDGMNASSTIPKIDPDVQGFETDWGKKYQENKTVAQKSSEAVQKKWHFLDVTGTQLPNSLLYQLKQKMERQKSFSEWIVKVKSRSAGKKLIEAGWYEELAREAEKEHGKYLMFRTTWKAIIGQQIGINKRKSE